MIELEPLRALGFRVFDLFGVVDGVCQCGDPSHVPGGAQARQAGKHPPRAGSFVDQGATASWEGNRGIATGAESSLWVVDLDPAHGGLTAWEALCAPHGEPKTLEVITGSGGRHLYFDWPDLPEGVDLRNSAGKLGPGIDVRGTGGYVVAPGSTHYSGGVYRWAEAAESCQDIEQAPAWLIELVTAPKVERAPLDASEFPPADAAELAAAESNLNAWLEKSPPKEGQGNQHGFAAACFLVRNWGLTVDEALPLFERYTQRTVSPRGPEESLALLENAARYGAEDGASRRAFRLARAVHVKKEVRVSDAEPSFSFELLKAKLQRSTHALVKRLLDGKPLVTRAAHGGARAKGGSVGAWLTVLTEISNHTAGEAWPAEMLWQVIEPSWLAEPDLPESPRTEREDIETSLAELRSTAVARVEASEITADVLRQESAFAILNRAGDPHDEGDWLAPHLDAKGAPAKHHAMAIAADALQCSSAWQGLRLDQFTQNIYMGDRPVNADILATQFSTWLSTHGLPEVGQSKDLLRAAAAENPFDSLVDYYDALPAYDGVDRLSTFDRDYLNVEGPDQFTREACRRWLIALVARAYDPGCQVDTALILRGTSQGERKSTFFATFPFYLDFKFGRTEDEDTRNLIGRHVVEFSELAALRTREREHAKNFLTKRTDKVRRMRADEAHQIPRRGVFCGTTNLDAFLDDPTGHRRYWPLTVGAVDYLRLKKDLPQILAQARSVWVAGEAHCPRDARCKEHRWFIDTDEPELFEAQRAATHSRKEESQVQQMIQEAILQLEPTARPKHITARWVFLTVEGLADKRTDKNAMKTVSEALRDLCGPEKRRAGGVLVSRHYRVPDALLTAPQQKSFRAGVRGVSIVAEIGEA